MSDWLHNLPVPVMALVIFGFTYSRRSRWAWIQPEPLLQIMPEAAKS